MELKIKTSVLKDLVSKAVKGVGNNKLLPITTKMAIALKDKTLTLTTTDCTNYLYVRKEGVEGDDFYIVVEAEQFSKLISKLTSEDVSIKLEETCLIVKGNGTYKIEIPMDESTDKFITFPDPRSSIQLEEDEASRVNLSLLKGIVESCKPSLAVTYEDPQYTGYYVGGRVITTNRETVASVDTQIFESEEVLLSPTFMNLVNVLTADKVFVYVVDKNVVFDTPECSIYGKLMEGVEDFEVADIEDLLETEMKASCSVKSSQLLSVLDRILLFIGQFDSGAIKLSFGKSELTVESVKADCVETIPYNCKSDSKPFDCFVDAGLLKEQIKAYNSDVVTIEYGDDKALKLVDGDLTILVCLMIQE